VPLKTKPVKQKPRVILVLVVNS